MVLQFSSSCCIKASCREAALTVEMIGPARPKPSRVLQAFPCSATMVMGAAYERATRELAAPLEDLLTASSPELKCSPYPQPQPTPQLHGVTPSW